MIALAAMPSLLRRTLALLAAVLLMAQLGCGGQDPGTTGDTGETTASAETPGAPLESFDPMVADGAHESEAVAAVAGIVESPPEGAAWGPYKAVEPRLVAYLVRVELGGQHALFEVHADGLAHNIHAYQRAFDSGSIIWTAAAEDSGPVVAPASPGEIAAVAAVDAAMRDAFPDTPFTVSVRGFRVAYVAADSVLEPLVVEVGPDGAPISGAP